jgi:hypothetical protein
LFYERLLGLVSAHFAGQWWSLLLLQDALGFCRSFLAIEPLRVKFPLDSVPFLLAPHDSSASDGGSFGLAL